MCELVFSNAFVVDGSGQKAFLADVGIEGEFISRIEKPGTLASKRKVECRGKILAPGFIDVHGHSDYHLLVLPSAESKLFQGITTEVGGNCGYSAAPLFGELKEERIRNLYEEYQLKVDFSEFREYLQRLSEKRIEINFVPLIGYNTVRAGISGYKKHCSKVERRRILKEVEKELDEGAYGVSAGLIYPPGNFTTLPELKELAKLINKKDGIFTCHIRSEGSKLIEAVNEMLELVKASGVRFQFSHLKTSGPENWHKLDKVFELIETSQANGFEICADRYPYLASFTSLSSVLPDWVFEGGRENYLKRLADGKTKKRIIEELKNYYSDDYWSRVKIAQVFSEKNKDLVDKTIVELSKQSSQPPQQCVVELLAQEKLSPNAFFFSMSEDNLKRIYEKKWVMVGSDSGARAKEGILARGKPHPRVFGTFAKFFEKWVREEKLLSIEEAVYRTSGLCARQFKIEKRGMIRENYYADLVLFDIAQIKDLATYENPFCYPEGIEIVVVNGKIAMENKRLTQVKAGKVLRKSS